MAAGAVQHQFLDELLQFSASPGDEQPDADGGVARRHGQNRGGGEGCGYAASLGQRKRVAHIPTAEPARSGLILEGQRQARLHLKFNDPWSHEWGPVQFSAAEVLRQEADPIAAASDKALGELRLLKEKVGDRNKVAKLLGVTGPYIGRVLAGEKPMTGELAAKLAQVRDKPALPASVVGEP